MSIIKNPVVLGVLAGGITYIYLLWSKKKDKKDKKEISLITPIIVAIAVCLVAYLYFSPSTVAVPVSASVSAPVIETSGPGLQGIAPVPISGTKYHFADPGQMKASSESPASFHLISKGVNIPNNVPEVFIETY